MEADNMEWSWLEQEKLKKIELEIGYKFEKLAKRYKRPGSFPLHYMPKDENGERYASMMWCDEWSRDSYCIGYCMSKEDMLKRDDILKKHDLLVITEICCNSLKNEIKYFMTSSLNLGFSIFKPVLHIKLCIKSEKYVSNSPDYIININPMPKVWKRLNMTKAEERQLIDKVIAEGFDL
jgi:hypothetical protein